MIIWQTPTWFMDNPLLKKWVAHLVICNSICKKCNCKKMYLDFIQNYIFRCKICRIFFKNFQKILQLQYLTEFAGVLQIIYSFVEIVCICISLIIVVYILYLFSQQDRKINCALIDVNLSYLIWIINCKIDYIVQSIFLSFFVHF